MNTSSPAIVRMNASDSELAPVPPDIAELAALECKFEYPYIHGGKSPRYLEKLLTRIDYMRTSMNLEPYVKPSKEVNVVGGSSGARAGPEPLPLLTEEDELMDKLRSVRANLLIQQDAVHRHSNTDKEIAEAEKINDELVRKIRCIEDTLLAFGSYYRTR